MKAKLLLNALMERDETQRTIYSPAGQLEGKARLLTIERLPPVLRWWQAVPIRTFVWAMLKCDKLFEL
ncbi:MAG: hypothetical protein JNJ46_07320 [Myxococcales bacterium]|nr:hypothetical protein [Myxococcales bacterium]